MSEILPVLVADLAEERARPALTEVAREKGNAWVPLLAAPVDTRPHLLEVYTPNEVDPLLLLARPLGPPSEKGFPLALELYEGRAPEDDQRQTERPPAPPAPLPARMETSDDTFAEARPPVMLDEHGRVIDDAPPAAAVVSAPLPPPRVPPLAPQRLDTPTNVRRIPMVAKPPTLSEQHRADLAGLTPAPRTTNALHHQGGFIGRILGGGKLEIESLIGNGSMGAVYRARHRELRIPVAVKILHETFQHDVEFCRRFYAEALAVSRLDHPNLVRVYDFGQEPDGLLYLSMEFLDGSTLRSLLDRRGQLVEPRLIELMLQVTAGLSHAHSRGLIHRDVKPDNVVVVASHDDDGRLSETVKLLDFGFAVPPRASGDTSQRLAGTPIYMSPEQCRGEELDERSDIYACGVLMFELATGKVPFFADKPIVIVNRHLSMPAPLVAELRPEIDPRLEAIIQRCLRKAKNERFATMRELRIALKELLQVEKRSPSGPPSSPSPSLSPEPPAVSLPPPAMPSVSLPPPEGIAAPPKSDAPPRLPSPPPPRPSKAPEWLEDRGDSYARFLHGMVASGRSEDVADILAREPVAWLKPFVAEHDPQAFAQKLAELDRAIRALAHRADAKALWAVSSAVHGIATEATAATGPHSRAGQAAGLLRLFTDPGMLGPIAERLLSTDDDATEAARTLIVQAKVAGAYALYGARVKLAVHARVRAPFVDAMTSIGEGAWPVVRAALEKIPETALTGSHPLAADLAEDLLLSVPIVRDEAAGHLVATYVRAMTPSLARAATRALARLWAERARPLLLGLLSTTDDGVRIAAIIGLRELGAVDEHAARRIAPLATWGSGADALRLAALQALASMTPEARPVAIPVLANIVRDPRAPDDATIVAAADVLVRTVGVDATLIVRERADRASEPIRSQLLALLA